MADTTPLTNQLNVNISRRLNDATTGADNGIKASADGTQFTAALRNQYINTALRWVVSELIRRGGVAWAYQRAKGAKTTQSVTFAANGTAINPDFIAAFKLIDSLKAVYDEYESKADLDTTLDPFLTNGFVIDNGLLLFAYNTVSGPLAQVTSGTGTLYYLRADRKTSTGVDVLVNTAPDTTIEQYYFDAVEDYALGLALYDKGLRQKDQEMLTNAQTYFDLAMKKLPAVIQETAVSELSE